MLLHFAFFLSFPVFVLTTPLYRFDNREAPASPAPSSSSVDPLLEKDKEYEGGPDTPILQAKEERSLTEEESSERQLPTVILEQNLKLNAVSGSLEDNRKEQERPNCETSEADSEDEDAPEETGKVPIMKTRFALVPIPCTEKELNLPLFKDEKSGEKQTVAHPNVVEIARMQIDSTVSTPLPNKSSLVEKHIDVTLRELDQPVAQVSNDDPVEEEEDTGILGIGHFSSELEEDLIGQFEPECDKDNEKPKTPSIIIEQPKEIIDSIDSFYEEQFFRITAYVLSLFADLLEDEPSTWQKIIAGVQCVLRDCREALPFRPSDRPLIKEGGFIIRRARESLCTCYIPGLTDN